jgi:5-methylcytosine-specific restriction endonuclease McrA
MLNSSVLVLNRLYQAIHITSVRKAFILLYKGDVKVVEDDFSTYDFENWCDIPVQPHEEYISTPRYKLKIPRVVLLVYYDKVPKQEVKFTRKNIYLRDRNRCQYCGSRFPTKELNLDHVLPISKGGKSDWANVVCCCFECNAKKGNNVLAKTGMILIKKPRKPIWHPLIRLSLKEKKYESWKNFLDLAYWNVELDEWDDKEKTI